LELSRREISQLGLLAEGAKDDVLWGLAFLYAQTGALRESHALARSRLTDWTTHFPAGRWRKAWEIAYPRPYADIVRGEAKQSGTPLSLAYAIMREESAFDPEAVSPAGAHGLMQLIVPTAKHVAKGIGLSCDESSLHRPATNVALGCRFLADLRSKFPANPSLAIPAYNAGPGAPARWVAARTRDEFDLWVEQIPYEETRRYTKRVLTSSAAYAFLYEPDQLKNLLSLPRSVAP
jgi:soluble lytic murein transglycosylase